MNYPKKIFSGYWGNLHCQGITIDEENGYIYYSFTTKLIKSDLDGNIVGSVDGIIGHLGCIDFNGADGKLYGSLEFKNDAIGRGILKSLNSSELCIEDAFYCAIFDVDKIDRLDMDAEKDGIMRAVYLGEVVDDFNAKSFYGNKEYDHKYACSGIDGTAWGPYWGKSGGKQYLNICYGVYGTVEREDNDYQIILTYDAEDWWDTVARPLNQLSMHKFGAISVAKNFLFTGSTVYGIQNLEYDAYSGNWLAAVYCGKKDNYPNYDMFVIDGNRTPYKSIHKAYGEEISELSLFRAGENNNGIYGYRFKYGATGVCSLGNGFYYFSQSAEDPEKGQYTNVVLYRATKDNVAPFEIVE